MSTVIEATRNELFDFPRLATRAGSIAARNRSYYGPNNPGVTYGNASQQNAVQSIVQFDLMDQRRFLLTKNLVLTGNFIPQFIKQKLSNIDSTYKDLYYPEGTGPQLDQSLQAIAARIRIGTQQGVIIEEIFQYGLMSNVIETFMESAVHKEFSLIDHSGLRWQNKLPSYVSCDRVEVLDNFRHCYDNNSGLTDNLGIMTSGTMVKDNTVATITGTNIVNKQARTIVFSLHHSSFLNRVPVIPLKLFNQALRIEIEFADPRYCFYNNYLGYPPQFALDLNMIVADPAVLSGNMVNIADGVQWRDLMNGIFNNTTQTLVEGTPNTLTSSNDSRHTIPDGGEFWVLTLRGKVVTVVIADMNASNAAVSTNDVNLYTEVSTTAFPLPAMHGTAPYAGVTYGAEIAAMQRIWGGRPAGGGDPTTSGALNPLTTYNEPDWTPWPPFSANDNQVTGTAAGQAATVVTLTAATNEIRKVFDTIWVLPLSCAPITGAYNRNSSSLAVSSSLAAPPSWQYAFQNLQLLVDTITPSDPVRAVYEQAFRSPTGISYPYTRWLYQTFQSQSPPAQGWSQFQINARGKSLRSILVVFTDEHYNIPSVDPDRTVFNLPALSSFRAVGINQAFLQVGGDRYPLSSITMDVAEQEVNHLPELYTCLNTAIGSNGAAPTFPRWALHREGRNYGKAGPFGTNSNSAIQIVPYEIDHTVTRGSTVDAATGANVSSYVDQSKFILGFNTSKNDGDLASGVDTSAAGSLILNIQTVQWGIRRYVVHVFAQFDAIYQLQENGSFVRM